MSAVGAPEMLAIEAKVVRPLFGRTASGPADEATGTTGGGAVIADLAARRMTAVEPEEETALVRFRRALDLEARIAAREPVTPDQAQWLRGYQDHWEYQSQKKLWDAFGDGMIG
jgi:hypothetical protein